LDSPEKDSSRPIIWQNSTDIKAPPGEEIGREKTQKTQKRKEEMTAFFSFFVSFRG
jgi:hypothetical protein